MSNMDNNAIKIRLLGQFSPTNTYSNSATTKALQKGVEYA